MQLEIGGFELCYEFRVGCVVSIFARCGLSLRFSLESSVGLLTWTLETMWVSCAQAQLPAIWYGDLNKCFV